jgi:hypothetical protein
MRLILIVTLLSTFISLPAHAQNPDCAQGELDQNINDICAHISYEVIRDYFIDQEKAKMGKNQAQHKKWIKDKQKEISKVKKSDIRYRYLMNDLEQLHKAAVELKLESESKISILKSDKNKSTKYMADIFIEDLKKHRADVFSRQESKEEEIIQKYAHEIRVNPEKKSVLMKKRDDEIQSLTDGIKQYGDEHFRAVNELKSESNSRKLRETIYQAKKMFQRKITENKSYRPEGWEKHNEKLQELDNSLCDVKPNCPERKREEFNYERTEGGKEDTSPDTKDYSSEDDRSSGK